MLLVASGCVSGMSNLVSKIAYYWRVLATGFCFATFGLGGVIVPLLVQPILWVLPLGRKRKDRVGKWVIHKLFRAFVELMRFSGIMTYDITGIDKLNKPGQLILANHPTLVDVVLLIAFTKNADCVVKASLKRLNPFTAMAISLAGYIANDDQPELALEAANASFKRGNSLVVFPESTRTTPGKALLMKRGAANIALKTDCTIRPVLIYCDPITLTKQLKWYQVPESPFHIRILVQEPLDISQYKIVSGPKAARQLTAFLEEYFTKELLVNE